MSESTIESSLPELEFKIERIFSLMNNEMDRKVQNVVFELRGLITRVGLLEKSKNKDFARSYKEIDHELKTLETLIHEIDYRTKGLINLK